MTEDEQHFLRLVEAVCQRPGLYVGNHYDFDRVVQFLDAYALGYSAGAKRAFHPFGSLLRSLEFRDGFTDPAWGWWRHYLHKMESEEAAIRGFPAFLREMFEGSEC